MTAIPSLSGVGTSVAFNPTTAAALKSFGVSVAPYGTATFDSATSTITFPITSGYAEIHSDQRPSQDGSKAPSSMTDPALP